MSNTVEGVVYGGFWMNKQNEKGVFMGVIGELLIGEL